jgi:hypothetical protein
VISQTIIEAALHQPILDIRANRIERDVVVEVFNVLVVRNIAAHCRVARLADVIFGTMIFLLVCSAINRLLEDLPSKVVVRNLSLHKWSSSRQRGHNGREREEHVIQESCVVDVLSLISDLEAGAAHAEVHAVHVDLVGIGLTFCRFSESVLVLEDGHLDVHLFLTSFVDRLCQSEEAGVRATCLFWNKALMGMLVRLLKPPIVGALYITTISLVLRSH